MVPQKAYLLVRPDIETLMGEEAIHEALEGTLERAWELINQRIIDSVLNSMQERC